MGHGDHQEAHLFQSSKGLLQFSMKEKNTTYGVQKVEDGR
jgi:hypothetical protein